MVYNAKSDTIGTISTFNYRKKITINHSGALTSYQMKLIVDHVNTNMKIDFGDIRFNTEAGDYIPYWIEKQVNDISADIWIKTDLVDGNTIIYMHYGNQNLTSASNGDNTFDFFDDFSSDLSKWTLTQSAAGNVQIISGEARILSNAGYNVNGMTSNTTIARPIIIEMNQRQPNTTAQNLIGYGPQPISGSSGIYFDGAGGANSYVYRRLDSAYLSLSPVSKTSNTELIRIVLPSIGYKLYWNNVLAETNLTWTTDNQRISIQAYYPSGQYLYIDDIRVRKYTSSEPTYATFAEQTDQSYTYRLPIIINNTTNSNALTNYQVSITVDTSDANKFHNSAADIRFTSDTSNYNEQLWSVSYPYWIESITNPAATKIWIKIDSIPASSTKTIYMYHGNQTAISESNGTNTFIVFSDSNDLSSWITDAGSQKEVIGGNLHFTSSSGAGGGITKSFNEINIDNIIECRVKPNAIGSGVENWLGFIQDVGWTKRITQIGIPGSNETRISYSSGSTMYSLYDSLAAGTWYRLKINCRFSSSQHDSYVYSDTLSLLGSAVNKTFGYGTPTGLAIFGFGDYTGSPGTINVYISWVLVRKYASQEPTFSTPVSATSMTITPSETPCRTEICTATANVTWTCAGALIFDFVPSIKIDGVPIVLDSPLAPATVGSSRIVTQSFTVSGLTVGTHSICPDPN